MTDAPSEATVLVERLSGGILLLRLNRPDSLNSVTDTMRAEFSTALSSVGTDSEVRVVVITGAGRGFCAGADLGGFSTGSQKASQLGTTARMNSFHAQWAGLVYGIPKPTIALVNGPAAGAGLGLALACDFRVASDTAVLAPAFAQIGLPGDNGIAWALTRLVGHAKALEILLLSERIDAAEAFRLGLVTTVVPHAELEQRGLELADRLAAGPAETFALMKRNLDFAETADYAASLRFEAEHIATSGSTGESAAAVKAFLEKRTLDFRELA